MQTLIAALQTKFAAASLDGTITGMMHLEEAPSGTSMPYAVMHVISAPFTQLYTVSGFGEPQIDFVVRAVGANSALVLCESLRDAYKNAILTLSSGQMVNTVLTMDCVPEPQDPVRDEQSRDTFGWIVSFRFTVI